MSQGESVEWASLPGYVLQADRSEIRVQLLAEGLADALRELGFVSALDPMELSCYCRDQQDKARLFAQLQRFEMAFAAGREWSPAEVFEHLRDSGLLQGAYRRLAWAGPGKPQLSMA